MDNHFYPDTGRMNNYSDLYCEIAMESYFNATNWFDRIKCHKFDYEITEERTALFMEIIKSVVFSAMAIEAFLNDYAAACLGDSDFYDNFDQLSLLSKFELIARFIMETKIDKSKAYYSRMKTLVRHRNMYVHNKSRYSKGYDTLEEAEEVSKLFDQEEYLDILFGIDYEGIKEDMDQAVNGLKAIRDVACFFDAHDQNVHALKKLFGIYYDSLDYDLKPYKASILSFLEIQP